MERALPRQPGRPLLDPALLSAIADLEFVARVTVDGTIAGLHRSPFHGYSAEFSQYRHYRPGDDLKYVDWKLLARTDRIYTRQYRETTNMVAQIALDTSASMAFAGGGGVTKIAYARLLAAALAHVVSRQGDGVGLVTFGDRIGRYLPSRTGASHLRSLLIALAKTDAGGGTAAAPALRRAIDLLRRRGLLLVISDLYDDGEPVERELRRAVRMGHEVAVFHVATREEVEFSYRGDVELEDMETGAILRTGAAAGDSYRKAFGEFVDRWRTRCLRDGILYTRVLTDDSLDISLRTFLLDRHQGPAR
jgi:uncharacterized protein (DUF58 family)